MLALYNAKDSVVASYFNEVLKKNNEVINFTYLDALSILHTVNYGYLDFE